MQKQTLQISFRYSKYFECCAAAQETMFIQMFPAVFTTLIGIQVWSGGSVSVIKPSSCEPIWQDSARDRFWARVQ